MNEQVLAWVVTDRFDRAFFGRQEFSYLPPIGSSIGITDRNGNGHYLRVESVRMIGVKVDSDALDLIRTIVGENLPTIYAVRDNDWSSEMRE